jgi:hypothetical protein
MSCLEQKSGFYLFEKGLGQHSWIHSNTSNDIYSARSVLDSEKISPRKK